MTFTSIIYIFHWKMVLHFHTDIAEINIGFMSKRIRGYVSHSKL